MNRAQQAASGRPEKTSTLQTGPYKLSFTAASLFIADSVKIASVYLRTNDWGEAKARIEDHNILQYDTASSSIRISRELRQRLKTLTKDQLELLAEGTQPEQKQLLWLSVCKCYSFIREFAIEVLRERFLTMDLELTDLDYDAFFNRKADWHEELDELKKTTRSKLKQVLFRMLREADLISEDQAIIPATLSRRMLEVLQPDAPMSFEIFPVSSASLLGAQR